MLWDEVRQRYPSEWVLIEAIDAFSLRGQRIIQQVTVVNTFGENAEAALREYIRLHREHPERELYVVNTNRPILNIEERQWLGIRAAR